jgi:hypothetical protein
MANELRAKRHIVAVKTTMGEILIGTDDLDDITSTAWFRDVAGLKNEVEKQVVREELEEPPRMERVVPQPRPASPQPVPRAPIQVRRPPVQQQAEFTEYTPDTMPEQVWAQMNEQQRDAWLKFYNITV